MIETWLFFLYFFTIAFILDGWLSRILRVWALIKEMEMKK